MKRILLLLLFFSGSFYAGAQKPQMRSDKFEEHFAAQKSKPFNAKALTSLLQLYDSIYTWEWDTLTDGWKSTATFKTVNIVYDANYNLISQLRQRWNGSNWVNLIQMTSTYNANNNRINELYQLWSSAWFNYLQYTYVYDANNNQTSHLEQTWNGSAWDNSWLRTYTYDVNNNQTSNLYQTWNGSVWVNDWLYTNSYDTNNNMINELYQIWNGSAWQNSQYYTATYDANNNLTSQLNQYWNGSSWVNAELNTFTYDANNNPVSQLMQQWNGSIWVNFLLYTNTYGANNNLTSYLVQFWSGVWINTSLTTYAYDANNNMTNELKQLWNGSTWQNDEQYSSTFDIDNFKLSSASKLWNSIGTSVMFGDSIYYYFHTAIGINDLAANDDAALNIYPNPSAGTFTLQSTNQQVNNSILTILNVLGEKVYSTLITHHSSLINLDAPAGIYFVHLRSSEKTLTRRIILSK